jgi:hypothetical protein
MTIIVRNERDYDIRTALRVHGLWLSGGMTLIGLQFLRPENTFIAPIYREMQRIAPEWAWGCLMVAVGLPRFILILQGMWRQSGGVTVPAVPIVILTAISSLMWLALAVLFGNANPIGWSCIAASILTGLDGSTCILVSRVAGSHFREAKNGRDSLGR